MGGIVSDVSGIGAVSDLVKDVADKIWPDPSVKAQMMLQVQQLDNQLAAGQTAINQVEAGNNSVFVSGWRPFIGWVCGFSLAYHYVFEPLLTYILLQKGIDVKLPTFDMASLSTILMGMLGLGTLHAAERMGDKGNLPWQKSDN